MATDLGLRQRTRHARKGRQAHHQVADHQEVGAHQPFPADADISVTICQIMALRAARNAGIAVPKSVADKCIQYVQSCQDVHVTGGFRYQQHGAGGPAGVGFARTAAGIVALYSAGQYDGENVKKGLEYLKQYQPGPGNKRGFMADPDASMHYFYGHYYAVQAMWIRGGDYWRSWYPAIRDDLLKEGSYRQADGSWSDRRFDTHYCTAMALIILEVPNNYLPILQR